MPAKKKEAKAKAPKVKKEKVDDVDPVNEVEEAERKALCQEADRIFKQTVKEDRDFNEFQQQREKLNYFWIVEKKKVEDKKAELRNKERELQDLEEKHQVEIKIYKQRVKHLLYEHQDEMTRHKTEAEVSLKLAQGDHRDGESELKVDRTALKVHLKEMELAHEDYLKALKQAQDKNITLLRGEFERKTSEVHRNFERRMKTVRERLEARRKAESASIEERKNAHIETLMKAHEKAFAEIKNYYNDITHNNLDLIKSLKEEVAEMRRKEQQDEKLMYEIAQENRRMSEPLRRARRDVERLRSELDRYSSEKEDLRSAKARLLITEAQLRAVQWETEVLDQRRAAVAGERDELRGRFAASVGEVQRRSGFRNLLLERKLAALEEEGQKAEACLGEALARSEVVAAAAAAAAAGGSSSAAAAAAAPPAAAVAAAAAARHGRLEALLESKAHVAADLAAEVAAIRTAHAHLIEAAGRKLAEFGVPKEELGYQPAVPVGMAVRAA